ncbi:MAG TPA: hypothetical protein VGH81_00845 [Rudaea sp.]|jgi:hypothetical protein
MLKRQIQRGEIFIAVSVLLLLICLVVLWREDHRLKEKEYADRVRRSAAVVNAKVGRWPDLEDRFFEDLEPIIVDVSEKVAQSHSTEPANRILYKGLLDAKGKASQRWLDEQLELSYAELQVSAPEAQSVFHRTIGALKYSQDKMCEELSISLQTVLRDDLVLKLKDSPDIGNILRAKNAEKRLAFLAQVPQISKPLRQTMEAIVEMSESDLLDDRVRARLLAPLAGPTVQAAPSD